VAQRSKFTPCPLLSYRLGVSSSAYSCNIKPNTAQRGPRKWVKYWAVVPRRWEYGMYENGTISQSRRDRLRLAWRYIYTFVITKKWKGGATREVQSEGPRAGQDAVLGEQDDVI
jgi:hypothetical protein